MLTCEAPLGLAVPGKVDNRKEVTHDFALADITVTVTDFDQLRPDVNNATCPRRIDLKDNLALLTS
jgi:hypothetical protein